MANPCADHAKYYPSFFTHKHFTTQSASVVTWTNTSLVRGSKTYDVCYRLETGLWVSYAQLRVVGPDAEVFVCYHGQ